MEDRVPPPIILRRQVGSRQSFSEIERSLLLCPVIDSIYIDRLEVAKVAS